MLQLNEPSTELPTTLTYDPHDVAQAREVEQTLNSMLRQGFRLAYRDEGSITLTPPPLPANSLVFHVLTDNGDDRLVWDTSDPTQVREAKQVYDDYIGKGYKAYSVRLDGKRGARLDAFDPLTGENMLAKVADPARRKGGSAAPRSAMFVPPTMPS